MSDLVTDNQIIYGINSILEFFNTDNTVDCVYIANEPKGGSIRKVISICKEKGILIKNVDIQKLNSLADGQNHQGVVALVAATNYVSVDDILDYAKEKQEDAFIIIAHEIEDHHNLGAIIRTAEAAGAHGIIIPKRNSATVSGVVFKTSAGAIAHIKVSKVTNTNDTIKKLKENGLWVFGADMSGENYSKVDYKGPIALVIGSEGKGLPRLVKENCDVLVSIPMIGKVNALNASVAGSILIYKILEDRLK
ncbi:MAG: 23S rRNA (guanosine(2251)-2'-O)-methyltransferase RlmB [Oscillospiraceae bacterium]